MRTHIYHLALSVLLLSALMSCRRDEAPQRRSDARSTIDHLVIKEIFYTGHAYTQNFPKEYGQSAVQNWYSDDAYITIYNPTSEVKYLDGLALSSTALDPSVQVEFEGNQDFRKDYVGVSLMSYFPGSGKEHPINPGQTIVIAKYAVDHAKDFFTRLDKELVESGENPADRKLYTGVDSFLDLSKADWEWTNGKNDSKNNPKVPDLVPIYVGHDNDEDDDIDLGLTEVTETAGIALVKLPWTAEDFAKNYPDVEGRRGYRHTIATRITHHRNRLRVIEISFDKAVDCITLCPKRAYKMNPYSKEPKATFDKGYTSVTDEAYKSTPKSDWPKYSGMSLIRKWDGNKYVDDNNSTSDFEVKPATLGLKK